MRGRNKFRVCGIRIKLQLLFNYYIEYNKLNFLIKRYREFIWVQIYFRNMMFIRKYFFCK